MIQHISKISFSYELSEYTQQADACLGIFAQTEKAMRVIPCKVYNCLQMGKPLITATTLATEGVLSHMDNAFLCESGNPEKLAMAIQILKGNKVLRDKLSHNGAVYFFENYSVRSIGDKVRRVIENVKAISQ